jgi:hypothetical protein
MQGMATNGQLLRAEGPDGPLLMLVGPQTHLNASCIFDEYYAWREGELCSLFVYLNGFACMLVRNTSCKLWSVASMSWSTLQLHSFKLGSHVNLQAAKR